MKKTLFIECNMGAAGDMLSAALLELHPDREDFVRRFNALGIPKVTMVAEDAVKCGIKGTHVRMMIDGAEEGEHHGHHAHPHNGMREIHHIVEKLALEDAVKADVIAVYERIADAEAKVHGVPVSDIHFHEVGTLDAIADVTAVCMLIRELSPGRVIVSPVHVGSGTVRCAHGELPVPAPATALLLEGVPVYGGDIKGELCTPTGAALLTYFADSFASMPVMRTEKTGYGMGKKDFSRANCVRVFFGETSSETKPPTGETPETEGTDEADTICELSCNIDDMTAEEIAFACEELMAAGALDVVTIAIGMKKGRPGTMVSVLCHAEQRDALVRDMFRLTTTLGIREQCMRRYILNRSGRCVDTEDGTIRYKDVSGYGVARSKAEYEDAARIAREKGVSLREARGKNV